MYCMRVCGGGGTDRSHSNCLDHSTQCAGVRGMSASVHIGKLTCVLISKQTKQTHNLFFEFDPVTTHTHTHAKTKK